MTTIAQEESLRGLIRHFESRDDFGPERDLDHARSELARQPLFSQTRPFTRTVRPAGPGAAGDIQTPGQLTGAFVQNVPRAFGSLADETPTDVFNQIRFQAQLAESIAQDPDRNWFHEQFVRGVRAIPDMADQVAGAGHFVAKLNPAYWAMEWILPEERSIDAAVKRYHSAVSAGRALIHASLPVSQPGPDDWRVAGLNLFTFSGDVTQAGVAQAPQLAAGAAGAAMRGSAIAGSKLFALAGTGQTIGGRMTETIDYYEQAARDGRISPAMAEFGVMFESSIAGTVTYVSEKVVGKYIIDRIPGGDRLIAHSARNYLTNMVIGASGEAVQESIFDGVLTDTMVSLYRAGTSGDDEALKNLASIYTFDPEYWNSVLYDGLVAAPIGGGFGGAAVWSARRQQRMADFQNALRFAQVLTDESAVRTDEHLSALTEQVIGRPQSEVDALVKMLRSDQFQGEVGSERAQRVKRLADMIEESAERWGHMARLSDEELEVAAAEGSDLTIDGVRIDRGEAQIEIMRRQAAQARQDAMESEARQRIIEAEQALDADETFTDENAESLIDEAEGPLTRYDATRARMKAAIPRVVEDMLSRPPGTPIDREALIATVQDVYALGRKKAEAVVRRAERVMEQERAAQDAMLGADEDITLTPDDEAALDRISTTIDVSVEAATSIRPQMRETGRTPPEATDEEAGEETQATRDEAATREATRQRIDQYLYRQPSGERLHIPGSETVIDISDAEGWWITPDLIGNPVMSYGDAIVFANVLRAEDASGQWQYAIRRNGDLTYTVVRRRATPEQQAAAQAARTPSTQTTAAPEAERSTGGSTAPAWRQSQVEFVDSFGGAFPAPLPDNLGEINPGINIRNGEQDFSGQRYRTREFIIGDPGGAPVSYVRMVAPKGMSSETPMQVQMATIDPDVLPEVAERAKANLLTALSTSRKPVTSMVPARGIFDPGSAWLLHEMQVRQAAATKRYDRAIEQGELTPEQVRAIFADYPRLPVPESAQESRDGDETETQDAGDEEAARTTVGEEPDEAATLGVHDPRLAPFHGRFAPIVLARLEEALSPIPSALEEAQNRIEIRRNSASDDNLAGSLLNVGFAIEPDDLDGLSPIQQAAIRRRVRVSEDDGATLREVLGSALYEAAKREAIGGEAVRLQYKIDQALGARGGIDPEMVLAAFLLEARRRGRPETGKKRPSYDWVDPTKLPVGTTFTIFGQQVEIADEGDAEPDIQVLLDMADTMLPASMIEAIPVDPGSLRLPDEGQPESPPSITPTQPGLLGEQFAGGITGSQRGMFQEGRSEIQAEEDAVNAEKQRRLDASEAGQLDLGDPASGTKSVLGGTLKFTEDEVDRLGEIGDILGNNDTMFSGIPIDPKKWAALIEASAIIIRGGARAFTDFARTMFRSFGERIIPYLRQLYEAARRLPGVDSNTMDGEATVRSLTDTDIERIARSEPSPEEIARGQKEAEARGGSAVNRDDAAQRGRADAGATRTGRARQRPELIVVDEPDIPEPQPFVTADTFGSATLDGDQVLGVNLALTRFLKKGGRGFLLADGTGVGKAQPLDAKILTPNGWTTMGEIKVGDTIIAADGSHTRVAGVYPQGEKPIYRVTMHDGSSTECCDEHLWLTDTHASRRNRARGLGWTPKVRSLNEIRRTIRARGNQRNHSIPMVRPVNFAPRDIEIDPYLIGVLIGDGYLGKAASIGLTTADAEIIQSVESAIPAGTILKKRRGTQYDYSIAKTERRGRPHNNPLLTALRGYGLMGSVAESKFVPDDFKFNSIDVRLAVLQGLLDTDGTVGRDNGHVSFSTVSYQLALDVIFLVQSLGGNAWRRTRRTAYTHNGERRFGQLCHQVSIALPPHIAPFRLSRKAALVVPRTKYPPRRYIDKIEYVGTKPAQCIAVEHESHLYVTDDFIVTHNTRQLLAIAHQFGKRTGKKVLLVTQNRAIIETRLIPDAALMGIDLSGIEFGTYNALADRKIGRGEYGLAIYDEAHQLKNTVSGRHNAAREVKSDHVLFSTATPLDRPTGAAYFMSEITGLPEQAIWRMLGFRVIEDTDRSGKKRRYAETEEGFSWAMILDNLISLRDRAIKQGAMLRREYPLFGDIATRTTVFPEGGVDTQRQIDREWQRQIAAEPRNFSLHAQRIIELGRWAETLKVQAAADMIESERKKGRQVVVAAEHHGVLTIRGLGGTKIQGVLETLNRTLEDRGVKVSRIYGGSTRGKIKAADDFQRGKTDVVLMTAASGGAGIDLDDQIGDRPRTLLILTPSFAGDVFDQVLGRVSRRNTRSPVKIVFLYNTQSIGDNHRQRVLKAKLDALYRIQRGADVDKALGFLKTSDTHDDTPDDDIGVDHDAQILGEQPKPQVPPGGPGGIENNYGGIPLVPLVAGTADLVSRNRTIQATVGFVVRDLIDRTRGLGGRAAEVAAHLGRRANSLDREVYGKLSGRIDEALVAVNGMGPKKAASIIRLMQGQRRTTKRGVKYEMARIVDAVEGRWTPTSPQDREAIEKIRAVIDGFGQEARDRGLIQKNFKDGKHQLFEHVPGGKVYARILTAEMIGVITGPDTQARNDIVDAIVHANGGKVSITDVLRHFNSIRKSWNDVGPEAAFSQVNAEFTREVPFMPSLVYTSGGAVPIFETQPYNFVTRYANHMSARLGYIGTFGQTVKGYHVVEPGTGRVLHFAATQAEADAWRSKNRPDGRLRRVKNLTQTITKRLVNEGRNIQPFIQMTRTLNAMPAIRMPVAPGEPTFKIRRAIAHLFDIFRIGMLSGRIIPNVGEPFGNTQSFVGLDDFTKAAWQLMTDYSGLVDSLEIDGAINANIINMGWDRNRPVTAAIRALRESVDRLALGAKFYEEFQERWAAAAVKAMVERMRRGKGRNEDVGSIMAMMSWDIRTAERLKNGNGTAEEYLMLLRRGAAFLTAGNMRAAEASMFSQHPGTKITPNTRNWFVTTRYSDMKARSLVRLIESTAEIAREHDAAIKRGDLKRAAEIARIHRAAYVKIARNMGGTTFAGVTGFLLNSLVVGGLLGLGIARAEFEDDTFEFLWESWLYAQFAGPYGSILRMMNSSTENHYEAIARGTMPGAIFGEAYDMVARRGAYQNLNRMEGAQRFASRFFSFGKISNAGYHAIAIYGFGADQTETSSFRLDTARRAFWRWFFEEGMTLNRSTAEIDEETRQFRQSMRQAYRAWTAGEDPWPYIDAALQVNEDADLESIRRSIRSRTILGDFNDDVYVPDRSEKRQQEIDARIQSLRDRIGDEAYDILKAHDNLLLGWADSFATPARRR